jgi:hypothetical protein
MRLSSFIPFLVFEKQTGSGVLQPTLRQRFYFNPRQLLHAADGHRVSHILSKSASGIFDFAAVISRHDSVFSGFRTGGS